MTSFGNVVHRSQTVMENADCPNGDLPWDILPFTKHKGRGG